jgi:hypothetical protein
MATDAIFGHMTTVWPDDPDGSAQRFAYRLKKRSSSRTTGFTPIPASIRSADGDHGDRGRVFGSDLFCPGGTAAAI